MDGEPVWCWWRVCAQAELLQEKEAEQAEMERYEVLVWLTGCDEFLQALEREVASEIDVPRIVSPLSNAMIAAGATEATVHRVMHI